MNTDDYKNELKLLSLNKASKLMMISVTTLKKLIKEGRIGVITINKQMKIPYLELKRFIQENLTNINYNLDNCNVEDKQCTNSQIINTNELFNELIQGV